ncbi:formyltransferase family protein [Belnapia rosea]|uniref:Formyl transferase n=1 Tax=Belnapia rosea TaxID=938405 RepID=A0A1G6JZ53_9PROT|nr:formyltransferase family protein [Belnapia rosea]SDC23973.1 Formyl transferase [Belnapia rosea]
MRIALFTLESALSAGAVEDLILALGEDLVLIGRSQPFRRAANHPVRQAWRHLRRSGPRLLPYLAVNYGLRPHPARLAALAKAAGAPLIEVEDVNGPAMAEAIRAARPTLLVSCHFDQIFTPETLALAPCGGINLHPSLLPRHRGPVPTIWALAEPEPEFGVTIHRLVPRIDAGAILAQRAVPLPPGISASGAARALHQAGVPLLTGSIADIAAARDRVREVSPLPYCPFPPPRLLRGLARRGRQLVGPGDVRTALRLAYRH